MIIEVYESLFFLKSLKILSVACKYFKTKLQNLYFKDKPKLSQKSKELQYKWS